MHMKHSSHETFSTSRPTHYQKLFCALHRQINCLNLSLGVIWKLVHKLSSVRTVWKWTENRCTNCPHRGQFGSETFWSNAQFLKISQYSISKGCSDDVHVKCILVGWVGHIWSLVFFLFFFLKKPPNYVGFGREPHKKIWTAVGKKNWARNSVFVILIETLWSCKLVRKWTSHIPASNFVSPPRRVAVTYDDLGSRPRIWFWYRLKKIPGKGFYSNPVNKTTHGA